MEYEEPLPVRRMLQNDHAAAVRAKTRLLNNNLASPDTLSVPPFLWQVAITTLNDSALAALLLPVSTSQEQQTDALSDMPWAATNVPLLAGAAGGLLLCALVVVLCICVCRRYGAMRSARARVLRLNTTLAALQPTAGGGSGGNLVTKTAATRRGSRPSVVRIAEARQPSASMSRTLSVALEDEPFMDMLTQYCSRQQLDAGVLDAHLQPVATSGRVRSQVQRTNFAPIASHITARVLTAFDAPPAGLSVATQHSVRAARASTGDGAALVSVSASSARDAALVAAAESGDVQEALELLEEVHLSEGYEGELSMAPLAFAHVPPALIAACVATVGAHVVGHIVTLALAEARVATVSRGGGGPGTLAVATSTTGLASSARHNSKRGGLVWQDSALSMRSLADPASAAPGGSACADGKTSSSFSRGPPHDAARRAARLTHAAQTGAAVTGNQSHTARSGAPLPSTTS
ncbi:MAG: hypothetical protein EOO41_03555, partial [Methanobacteriota archaeon]